MGLSRKWLPKCSQLPPRVLPQVTAEQRAAQMPTESASLRKDPRAGRSQAVCGLPPGKALLPCANPPRLTPAQSFLLFISTDATIYWNIGTECSKRIAQVSVCFGRRFIYVICEGKWHSSHTLWESRQPRVFWAQGWGAGGEQRNSVPVASR